MTGVSFSDCVGKRTTEVCNVSCSEGYTGTSTAMRCAATGEVTGTIPTCTANQCANDIVMPLIDFSGCSTAVTGEHCLVKCSEGYSGTKTNFVCSPTGNIAGTLPADCKANVCANDTAVAGVNFTNCTGKRTTESCSVSCSKGYTGTGVNTTVYCAATGNITGAMPTCTYSDSDDNTLFLIAIIVAALAIVLVAVVVAAVCYCRTRPRGAPINWFAMYKPQHADSNTFNVLGSFQAGPQSKFTKEGSQTIDDAIMVCDNPISPRSPGNAAQKKSSSPPTFSPKPHGACNRVVSLNDLDAADCSPRRFIFHKVAAKVTVDGDISSRTEHLPID